VTVRLPVRLSTLVLAVVFAGSVALYLLVRPPTPPVAPAVRVPAPSTTAPPPTHPAAPSTTASRTSEHLAFSKGCRPIDSAEFVAGFVYPLTQVPAALELPAGDVIEAYSLGTLPASCV
jgi:hypothetical protein